MSHWEKKVQGSQHKASPFPMTPMPRNNKVNSGYEITYSLFAGKNRWHWVLAVSPCLAHCQHGEAVTRVRSVSESLGSPQKVHPVAHVEPDMEGQSSLLLCHIFPLWFTLLHLCSEDFHANTKLQISITHLRSSAGCFRITPRGQGESEAVPWSCCWRLKLRHGPCAEFLCGIITLLWTLWLNFMD